MYIFSTSPVLVSVTLKNITKHSGSIYLQVIDYTYTCTGVPGLSTKKEAPVAYLLERLPCMGKARCLNPSRNRTKLLKQVMTALLLHAQ